MQNDLPDCFITLAESLGGKVVERREQVADSDIIVAISCSHAAKPLFPIILIFWFAEEAARREFKSQLFRGYEDDELFAPWHLEDYISQPARDYFEAADAM